MPTFSLLICTRNRAGHLAGTLASVAGLRVPPGLTGEVIVVDNGSTDDTRAVVEGAPAIPGVPLRYLEEHTPGLSNARNAALAAATGKVLLWTDDDVRLPSEWLAAMSAPLLDGTADAVTAKVRMAPALERPWMTRTHFDRLADTRHMPADFGTMTGASMGFHRRVLARVPGFDVELGVGGRLGSLEECLFSWQLTEAGFRLRALPELTLEHHFEARRLLRTAWLQNAHDVGCSEAWLRHHWEHRPVRWARARLTVWSAALATFRVVYGQPEPDVEGCDRRELRLAHNVAFCRQALRERSVPPAYDRRALVRRAA